MRERISNGSASYHFDSLAELSRYIETAPNLWRSYSSQNNPSEQNWDLGDGYKACVRMAGDGWLEGAQEAQRALNALPLKSPAPDTKTDFYGFLPHVPRFCAGAPDSMIRRAREAVGGSGKVLTLYVPVNALGSVKGTNMRNFGLGVAQYINQLEMDGVRVELYGVIRSQVSGWNVTHSWLIKRADQFLDLAVLGFSIGHPGMFRRLGFALRERCAAPRDYGYGRTVPCKLADLIDPPHGAYILNGMALANDVASTPDKATKYIANQIDKMLSEMDAD